MSSNGSFRIVRSVGRTVSSINRGMMNTSLSIISVSSSGSNSNNLSIIVSSTSGSVRRRVGLCNIVIL